MTKKDNKSEFNKESLRCATAITDVLHQCGGGVPAERMMLAAHLLAIVSEYNHPFGVDLDAVVTDSRERGVNVSETVRSLFAESDWEKLKELCRYFDGETFSAVAALPATTPDKREDAETPASIAKLATKILDVQTGEAVGDLCCGKGSVLLELEQSCPDARFVGVERNTSAATLGRVRVHAAKSAACIETEDVFRLIEDSNCDVRFDKIFSNYPFGVNLRQLSQGQEYLNEVAKKVPGFQRATSSDWLFNHLMLDLLKDGGKAVGIMTNGSTLNGIDRDIRKYFVENGFVEAIIALPAKLFSSFSIPTTMIVLSRGNTGIRMVDATEQCTIGRRQNMISDENIAYILDAYYNDNDISRTVALSEVQENDHILNPKRYLQQKTEVEGGVPLGDIIKNITRGAHCSAEQLDAMASQTESNLYFLKTSDIQDGLIGEDLQPLSYIEDNFKRYCLKDRDLVISKIGAPYKMAVAVIPDGQMILPNANLYVVTVDESKVDPYYLKACLESTEGQAQLKNITVGAMVQSIGVKDLKSIRIPLLSLAEQKEIAAKYREAMADVIRLKKELGEAIVRMNNVFAEHA